MVFSGVMAASCALMRRQNDVAIGPDSTIISPALESRTTGCQDNQNKECGFEFETFELIGDEARDFARRNGGKIERAALFYMNQRVGRLARQRVKLYLHNFLN